MGKVREMKKKKKRKEGQGCLYVAQKGRIHLSKHLNLEKRK